MVRVDSYGKVVKRETKQAKYFKEQLPNDVTLDMVYIPGGSFVMGSPEGYYRDISYQEGLEFPQHWVTVPDFYLGKYPITQEQWEAIASLPKIERDLKVKPSFFEGKKHPVEQVSWDDVREFCQRLARYGNQEYGLPSEAEWEYACRAVIDNQLSANSEQLTVEEWNKKYHQPFSFGETITSKLANYDGNYTYANEPLSLIHI